MGNYIRDIFIDKKNADGTVTAVDDVEPRNLPGGDFPQGYNLLGILFNYRPYVGTPALQPEPYGMADTVSQETQAYLEHWDVYRSRYTITRENLEKFDPESMVENLRPNHRAEGLKPGEGVMVKISDFLHEHEIEFVKYLLAQPGNLFHFMMD